jgi:hypothetical protein
MRITKIFTQVFAGNVVVRKAGFAAFCAPEDMGGVLAICFGDENTLSAAL